MTLTTPGKTALATAYATANVYGALFTADPGATGTATGEVTGGSPAYNRKSNSWGTASAGVVTTTAAPTFDIPSGTTVTFYGTCTSVTPGAATVADRVSVTSQAFASQGTYQITPTYTQS